MGWKTNSRPMLQIGNSSGCEYRGVRGANCENRFNCFQVVISSIDTIAARKRKAISMTLAADKPTILVVDDQEIIADTTAAILNRFGFQAVHTYDAHTALQIAATLKPDFLLTDVSMPIMNGVELAIAITKLSPGTKILLFSGQAGVSNILREGEEKGYVFDLVAKPIHPENLVQHLNRKSNDLVPCRRSH
jgi:CheY-like chemotaxis protein